MTEEAPVPSSPNQQFEDIINHETWSDEAIILNAPTPLEVATSHDRITDRRGVSEVSALLPQLEGTITQLESAKESTETEKFLGGRGMIVLNEMADIAIDTLNDRELAMTPHRHYSSPQGHEAVRVIEAFPNPASLVGKFGELMDIRDAQAAGSEGKWTNDRTGNEQAMEQLAEVIYGDRWRVYKDTLRKSPDSLEQMGTDGSLPGKHAGKAQAEFAGRHAAETPLVEVEPGYAGRHVKKPEPGAEAPEPYVGKHVGQASESSEEYVGRHVKLPEDDTIDSGEVERELEAHEVLSGFEMYRTDVREGAAEFVTGVQRKLAQTKKT